MPKPAALLICLPMAMALVACDTGGPTSPPAGDGTAVTGQSTDSTAPAPVVDTPTPAAPAGGVEGRVAPPVSATGAAGASGGAPRLVASVDGQPITLADFQRQAFDTQRYFVDQGGIDPNTPDGQQQLLVLRRKVLSDMIDQVLLEQAAGALNIAATEAEVDAAVQKTIDDMGGEDKFVQ